MGINRDIKLDHEIRLSNVSFKYPETSLAIVSELNLVIPSKKMVVFTGGSGSGKTTVLDLLIGLIQPTAGQILVDELPLLELDKLTWKSKIGYVPQDPMLFHKTILENITLDDDKFKKSDVMSALSLAGAADFVDNLHNGVHTNVGEEGQNYLEVKGKGCV